jgi:tetrathionate reductase subunit A
VICSKSQLQSSHSIGAAKLRQIHARNGIIIHPADAQNLGIQTGDLVRVTSPGGKAEGIADLRYGVQRGVIGIEHGFGHWGLGASRVILGGETRRGSLARGAGVAHNLLGIADPKRQGISTLADMVVGANARQDIMARVEKV